jgi:hypothetical protein
MYIKTLANIKNLKSRRTVQLILSFTINNHYENFKNTFNSFIYY